MVVDTAMFVVHNQQNRAFPEVGIIENCVVDLRHKNLALLDVVIGMLVGSDFSSSISLVVVVVRLDEAVVRKIAGLAILEELIECCENLGLILQQVDDFHGRTWPIVVVNLGRTIGQQHALIDAQIRSLPLEDVHADLAERSAVVCECPIADSGAWYRGKPTVEDGELLGQSRKNRKFFRRKVIHDFV